MQLAQGASGSGLADYSTASFLNLKILPQLNLTAPVAAPYADNVLQVVGSVYPNIQLYVPRPAANTNPIVASGSVNLGDIPPGSGLTKAITFPSALADNLYYVMGTMRSVGSPTNDCLQQWVLLDSSIATTGFSIHAQELSAVSQNLIFDYICFHH